VKICTGVSEKQHPCGCSLGHHGRTLCRESNNIEYSTCRVVVANPSSGFKSILQGMCCMSANRQAIVEGCVVATNNPPPYLVLAIALGKWGPLVKNSKKIN